MSLQPADRRNHGTINNAAEQTANMRFIGNKIQINHGHDKQGHKQEKNQRTWQGEFLPGVKQLPHPDISKKPVDNTRHTTEINRTTIYKLN